jgi:hypothetical protein
MKRSAEGRVIEVLESFCAAFADRRTAALTGLIGAEDLVVITSEQSLLRGPVEFGRFLDQYLRGPTTYSWNWDRHDVSIAGSVAWILAEGIETVTSGDRLERHPYRMTMVLARRQGDWIVRQVHGSVPH